VTPYQNPVEVSRGRGRRSLIWILFDEGPKNACDLKAGNRPRTEDPGGPSGAIQDRGWKCPLGPPSVQDDIHSLCDAGIQLLDPGRRRSSREIGAGAYDGSFQETDQLLGHRVGAPTDTDPSAGPQKAQW
jgi:hypothetical protein